MNYRDERCRLRVAGDNASHRNCLTAREKRSCRGSRLVALQDFRYFYPAFLGDRLVRYGKPLASAWRQIAKSLQNGLFRVPSNEAFAHFPSARRLTSLRILSCTELASWTTFVPSLYALCAEGSSD